MTRPWKGRSLSIASTTLEIARASVNMVKRIGIIAATGALCATFTVSLVVTVLACHSAPIATPVYFLGYTNNLSTPRGAAFLITNQTHYAVEGSMELSSYGLNSFELANPDFPRFRLHGVEFPDSAAWYGRSLYLKRNGYSVTIMPLREKTNSICICVDVIAKRPDWQCKMIKALAACRLYVYNN